jgi:hypothetical protein
MKKKDKPQKRQGMPEFAFKEFTAEESRIYEEAVNKDREAVSSGKTLKQAYESYAIGTELGSLIQADFLKILIVERHFAQQQPGKIARLTSPGAPHGHPRPDAAGGRRVRGRPIQPGTWPLGPKRTIKSR